MRPSRTATCVAVGIDGFIVTIRAAENTLMDAVMNRSYGRHTARLPASRNR
jgi:hypothetical protein